MVSTCSIGNEKCDKRDMRRMGVEAFEFTDIVYNKISTHKNDEKSLIG